MSPASYRAAPPRVGTVNCTAPIGIDPIDFRMRSERARLLMTDRHGHCSPGLDLHSDFGCRWSTGTWRSLHEQVGGAGPGRRAGVTSMRPSVKDPVVNGEQAHRASRRHRRSACGTEQHVGLRAYRGSRRGPPRNRRDGGRLQAAGRSGDGPARRGSVRQRV